MSIDLTTHYLKLSLRNPIVVSACPLGSSIDTLVALQDAGVAAVVLPSLFAEQIEHEEHEIFRLHEYAGNSSPESLSYFPELESYNTGPEPHLEHVEAVKKRLQIPVIASLNATSPGKWTRYARLFELAGADALELNIYFVPTNPESSAADVERRYLDIIAEVASEIRVPLALKIGPYFSSLPHFASQAIQHGASGLVLFNRYLDPDLDLGTLVAKPHLELSTPSELRLVLRWLAILRDQVDVSLAATSGVHTGHDVIKTLLAGANAVMMASALLKHGPQHVSLVLEQMQTWLDARDYASVSQMIGSASRQRSEDASAFERGNYMKALVSYTKRNTWG
jgi:dihydroorotate dehydrogenase (fumarate)